MILDQGQQLLIHLGKHQGTDLVTCKEKRLSRHHAHRVGLIPEIGEELIEFRLHRALQAREQKCEDGRKSKGALASKKYRPRTSSFQ